MYLKKRFNRESRERLEENIKKLFEIHEKNEEWFSAHYEELNQKYGSKFFAVTDQKVVAVEEEMERLLDVLKKKGIDINLVFISSISPKGVASIL